MPKLSKTRLLQLKNEIRMSEALIERKIFPQFREAIQRYTGSFTPAFGTDWDIVLNEIYPVVQYNLPSIFFRNPKAFLKPKHPTFIKSVRDPVSGKKITVQADSVKSARTQEGTINYILPEIRYKQEVRKVLMDALLFPYGVMWHGYKGSFGMTEENSLYIEDEKIFVKRISPLRFGKDPAVTMENIDDGKFVYRRVDMSLQDLIEDDELNVSKQLKGVKGFGDKLPSGGQDASPFTGNVAMPSSLLDVTTKEYRDSSLCNFVKVYEVFLRPTRKEKREGKKGKILLITDEQEEPLRENDWDIMAEGFPAVALMFNPVPDQMFPLPDIDTYKTIADQKNVIVNLQLRNAQENSKLYVGISKGDVYNEEELEHIQKGDQTIILFNGDTPVNQRMTVQSGGGGASQELYIIDQRIQKNLEDKSGVTDLKRGFLQSGEESATSVKARIAGGAARPRYRQDIMTDFLKDSIHYLLQLEKQFFTVKDVVRIMGSLDIEWTEKPTKEDLQADTDVDIDVISMLPEDPEREVQEIMQVLSLMLEALNNPAVMQKLMQENSTLNLTPLIEQLLMRLKINNPEVFRRIRPDESMGMVSVQQLKEAEANVVASMQGTETPFPPKEGDDHRAKLEVYGILAGLLSQAQLESEQLMQIIQQQQMLLEMEMEKQDRPGQKINLKQPKMRTL